jgi:hypothetical protein
MDLYLTLLSYGVRRTARRLLSFTLLASSFVPTFATGRTGTAPSLPPEFPDAVHVPEGCYLSAFAYLHRFRAEFPDERGQPLTLEPRSFDRMHTVALITWHQRWWIRDEFFGLMELGKRVGSEGVTSEVHALAQATFDRRALTLTRRTRARLAEAESRKTDFVNRVSEVATAAQILPCASERFWVRSGNREIPLLFFRPAPGVIAVYHPVHGTATAETKLTESSEIVACVAIKLGYPIASIRRDTRDVETLIRRSTTVASHR